MSALKHNINAGHIKTCEKLRLNSQRKRWNYHVNLSLGEHSKRATYKSKYQAKTVAAILGHWLEGYIDEDVSISITREGRGAK